MFQSVDDNKKLKWLPSMENRMVLPFHNRQGIYARNNSTQPNTKWFQLKIFQMSHRDYSNPQNDR